jgi:hypothetical protein
MRALKLRGFCFWIAMASCLIGRSQTKVLFIGNSQLEVSDGITSNQIYDLPGMIKSMSESAPADYPRIETGKEKIDGASLKIIWELGEGLGTPRAAIVARKWDYVVIQEIYYADKTEFETYASLFDEAIRKTGAKTILFATAGVTNSYDSSFPTYPDGFVKLNDMQVSFGRKERITVAAAGYAWMRYLGPDPSEEQLLDLYSKDKGHPGYKGSYIYACMLYAVITGKNPAELTSEFIETINTKGSIIISREEAAKMQKAAWDQYLENSNN